MRTAEICPTCATYTNATCVIYDGDYLSCTGISPMDNLQSILELIDGTICTLSVDVANVINQVNTLSYNLNAGLALKEDTANKSNGPLGSSTVLFPTEYSVKTYVDTQDSLDEKLANKVTTSADVIANGSSVVKYPAIKAIKDYVDGVTTGLLQDNGNYDPTITSNYPTSANTLSGGNPMIGDIWYISANGTVNGNPVLVGYTVRALVNNAGATTDADWAIANVGLGYVPENSANKSDDGTFNSGSPSHTLFPTQFAVADYLATNVSTIDLQTVLGNGHTLTNGRNFQGDNAGNGNTGFDINAFGQGAGVNNSGNNINAFGVDAANTNSGNSVNAIGQASASNNTGSNINGIGHNSAFDNTGSNVNALGESAAEQNNGGNVNAMGLAAAYTNQGNNVNAFGYNAGIGNTFNNVTLLGSSASASANDQLAFSNGFNHSAQFSNTNITGDRKYELPDVSGTIPLTVNGIAADNAGNIVVPTGGGGGTVSTIKVSLPSSAILALNATPFELIPAPGAGKTINVLKVFFKYNFNTTPYSGGGGIAVSLGSGFGSIPVSNAIGGVLNNFQTSYAKPTMYTGSVVISFGYANIGLYLTAGLPQTGGDGSLDVYITYDVVTL